MEFRILGPLEIDAGGESLALGSAQQRAVLALLLIGAPEPVSVDRLVDELWGERPPASAQHAVQVYVSGIRKILRAVDGNAAVRTAQSGYVLDVDSERVDARRFERLLGQAQRVLGDDPSHARELFGEALELWRGPPLAEFEACELARLEADRLEELRAVALERLVEARLAGGEHVEMIGQITGLVAANPLRERPRQLLMLALYRGGRHAEALAAYRDACAALDEIGLQPGPELRQLEDAILRHDESLRALTASPDPAGGAAGPSVVVDRPALTGGTAAAEIAGPDRAEPSARRGRRKVVTALFCDVTGSTALGEELDPEALHGVMNRYFSELRATIERHGGTVAKFIGDAVMAVFGIPVVREDDALRAVRAAAEIRERLPAVAEEVGVALAFRTGVNTGLVLVGEGENLAIGDAVNIAARLEQAAAPDEILLGDETLRLVRDAVEVEPLEPLALKGKSAPVLAFRLLRVDPLAPGLARHMDVPLVGRERELGVLRAGWDRTVQECGCHLFTLLGVAGVGKSRLVAELLTSVGDAATALSGRCLPYGEGITFWPLVEALTPVGELAQHVLDRLGTGGAATAEELFWEIRRLLESLAVERPVILHIDDLQWSESMLLDLLDHIVELSRGAPILLLCTARPELLDDRPTWGGGKLNAATVLLEPLDPAQSEVLLDQLGAGLATDARTRVIVASDGNPLFLEEIAALTRERGEVAVPPTIQALLAARLERLASDERELLERGAIEGEIFHATAVRALGSEPSPARLAQRLAGLVRKDLIRPYSPSIDDDDVFRFRHILIRDAAYEGLSKAARAELHERFADWLEDDAHEPAELDEITGWHLEQAVRYRRELGREADAKVVRRAAEHLYVAGRRATERGDANAARSLLERAHSLAPDGEDLQLRIGVDLAEQLVESDDLARVDALLSDAERNEQTTAATRLVRLQWAWHTGAEDQLRNAESTLSQLTEQGGVDEDHRLLTKAHLAAVQLNWLATRYASANEDARLAIEHARLAGDDGLRARAIGYLAGGLVFGPESATEIGRELDSLESEPIGAYAEAFVHHSRGELARLAGRFPEARRNMQEAIDRFQDLGIHAFAAGCYHHLAAVEVQAGDPTAALTGLQKSDAILERLGARGFRSSTQAELAIAYTLLADHEAARRAIELATELADPHDTLTHTIVDCARAELARRAGDGEEAERWARRAVKHASRIDSPTLIGQVALELGRVLRSRERPREAVPHVLEALLLFEAKGDEPSMHDARTLLAQLDGSEPVTPG